MAQSDPISVAQLSDTHFLEEGEAPEGGFAYDTAAAFDAVHAHMTDRSFDLVAVTGDVADHGRAAQYRKAADAFALIDAPVNVCPGNHDQDHQFTVGMGRPSVATSRVVEVGAWCFLFADSNAGVMTLDDAGRRIDPEYEDRLHRNGALGAGEASWIRDAHDATEAPHVFIWIHHPPAPTEAISRDEAYAAEWSDAIAGLDRVRGIGAGHTHVPSEYSFGDVPVFVAPSLKNNFDLTANTLLPPGYRTYDFAADGSVSSEVVLTDDDRWPRHPMSRSVIALFNGELTFEEFEAIVARRQGR